MGKAEASRREVERRCLESEWSLQYAKNRERLRADSQHATSDGLRGQQASEMPLLDDPEPTLDAAKPLEASAALKEARELAERQRDFQAKRDPLEAEHELWETMLAKNRYARRKERAVGGTPR